MQWREVGIGRRFSRSQQLPGLTFLAFPFQSGPRTIFSMKMLLQNATPISDSGSTEEARRWVLKVRCHDDDEVRIPMQVYASLKRVEGRNVKATGRVDTRRRRQPPVSVRSQPPVAAAASSSSGNNEEMEEVELLRRGYQSKVMRMSRDMRRLKLQEFRLRGLI